MEELFKLPKLSLKMEDGTINKWLKEEGEYIAEGEPLVEVSIGKVNMQVDAPVSGKLVKIIVPAGTKVPVGAELAIIELMAISSSTGTGGSRNPSLKEEQFDVVVIGGGPGGYVAAIRAAQLGGRVALVEKKELGGTCLNRGCIPTKALARSAQVLADLKRAGDFGLEAAQPGANLSKIMHRKDTIVGQLRSGIEHQLRTNDIKVVSGTGKLAGQGLVEVADSVDRVTIKTRNIIIATGSRPARVPIPGAESPGVLTSDDILKLDKMPDSPLILGGGVIGVEMAWIFHTFGVKVTIIELLPRLLFPLDEEIALHMQNLLSHKQIPIYTGHRVNSISPVEGVGLAVCASSRDGENKMFFTDKMLIAAGRDYNSQELNLEQAGITLEKQAIQVDAGMRTGIPGIYAIGDVTGTILLAHVASAQGIVAAENAMGGEREMNYSAVPNAIFTVPEIGTVGLTEEQARERGIDIKVSRFPFAAIGKALAMGETEGQMKLLCEKSSGKILGAHIIGPDAADLVAIITVSMQNGLTAGQLAHTIFAHPTTAEIIMEAAHGIYDQAIHY